ncbi:MAG: response regulator [Desulfosoma sp.]
MTMWKILLVDDNPNDRFLMMRLLAKEFPEAACVEVPTAAAFESALKEFDFQAVVTDYDVRWASGLEVLRRVKERDPYVPVVMVTGTGTEEVAVQALKEGLSDYIIKQHMRRLPAALKEALEKAELKKRLDRTLEQLKASEHRYRMLVEWAQDTIFTLDLQGRYTSINQRSLDRYGLSPEDFLGKTVSEVHEARGAPYYSDLLSRVFETKQAVTFEYPFAHRGMTYWHRDTLYPILDARGNVEAVGGISADITDRVQAEEKNRLLSTALEQAAEGIAVATADGKIIYANTAFTRLTGYDPSELEGRSLRMLQSSRHEPSFYQNMWATVRSGQVWRGDVKTRIKDGRDRLFEVLLTPVRSASGIIVHVVSVNRDVTEQRALESQVVQSQKMQALGTLAGGIAHDFNNILGAVVGYAELARLHIHDRDKVLNALQHIVDSSKRARDLVQQILTFSRPSPGVERKPVQLRYVAREVVKMLRATLPSTIEIRENFPADIPVVMADPTQMHQVLINLCTNAFHAMRDDGGVLELSLSLERLAEGQALQNQGLDPGEYVVLSVKDTGHGMSPEVLERIFEPYFTTKEIGEGTGLGLSVVYGIVRDLGGAVGVESRPGQGSLFRVFLPAAHQGKERHGAEAQPSSPPRGTERIVVVDDEPMLVEMTRHMLGLLGYTVTGFSDPEQALAYVKAHADATDLVITDLTMPKLTGPKLAQAIREIRPDLPMVLMSGYGEGVMESKARSLGFAAFLKKPYGALDLATTVRSALDVKSP